MDAVVVVDSGQGRDAKVGPIPGLIDAPSVQHSISSLGPVWGIACWPYYASMQKKEVTGCRHHVSAPRARLVRPISLKPPPGRAGNRVSPQIVRVPCAIPHMSVSPRQYTPPLVPNQACANGCLTLVTHQNACVPIPHVLRVSLRQPRLPPWHGRIAVSARLQPRGAPRSTCPSSTSIARPVTMGSETIGV